MNTHRSRLHSAWLTLSRTLSVGSCSRESWKASSLGSGRLRNTSPMKLRKDVTNASSHSLLKKTWKYGSVSGCSMYGSTNQRAHESLPSASCSGIVACRRLAKRLKNSAAFSRWPVLTAFTTYSRSSDVSSFCSVYSGASGVSTMSSGAQTSSKVTKAEVPRRRTRPDGGRSARSGTSTSPAPTRPGTCAITSI